MDYNDVIQQVIEKCEEYSKHLNLAFIDYKTAFDSVEMAAVMAALRDKGVEVAYVRFLEDIYQECTGTMILHKKSGKFPTGKVVRQGDAISQKLFTACLESDLGS